MKSTIIEIESPRADEAEMKKAVTAATGDPSPFFCPAVVPNEPYKGHAHTFPPGGATNVQENKIVIPSPPEQKTS